MKKIQKLMRQSARTVQKCFSGIYQVWLSVFGKNGKFFTFLKSGMEKRRVSACWMNIATLLAGLAAFEVYRSLSLADARYEGKLLLHYFSIAAPIIIWLVIAWEFICLIGLKRWQSFGARIQMLWKTSGTRKIVVCLVAAAAGCIGLYFYVNWCETEYYDEVVEFFGVPDGVGDPLSPEEREVRAGYWRIDNYPRKHRMTLTYVDAYGQPELMSKYSSAYDRMFFQPVARIEYHYKKSEDKFHAYGQECHAQAGQHDFREPEEITYYAGNGQVLLKLSGDGYEKLKVEAYASENAVQLLGSTLFRVPEGQTAGSGVTSWQLENSYDIDGRPLVRKLSAGVCNLYGVNGERYTYDARRRLASLCYLDENGMPACNKEGIMLITFQYDEDGGREIAYYSDENGTERTEGYHGVYCEELKYDSNGNLTERRQRDKQGRWCCDGKGVYKYVYQYTGGRLKSEAYFGVDEEPVRIQGWDSQMISFAQERSGKTQTIKVFLDSEEVLPVFSDVLEAILFQNNNRIKTVFSPDADMKTEYSALQTVNRSDAGEIINLLDTWYGQEDDYEGMWSDRGNNPVGYLAVMADNRKDSPVEAWDNDQGGQTGDQDIGQIGGEERKRNYMLLKNIITEDSLMLKFYGKGDKNVTNELGFAAIRILYDDKMRKKEVAYLDLNEELCIGEDGFAVKKIQYQSEDDNKIKKIEYLNKDRKRTINTEEGYSCVTYQYSRQGESELVTSRYFDSEDKPVYLSAGYAAVDQLYDKSGFMIQETYRDKNGIITCRNDYGVAEILYEYGDDGNLNRIWYKDTDEKPVNRIDTGYAVVYQEYRAGQLVRRYYEGYRNATLCPVSDKTTGVCETVYQYGKGNLQREEYYDGEGRPVLSSDLGCAAISYEYDDEGNVTERRYYGTDGRLILRKDTGYAVIRCRYNEEEQYNLYEYLDEEEQPVIHSENHCAGSKVIYDGDNLKEIQYLDLDGSLMNRSDYGIARVCKTYFDNGKRTEEYYDAEGNHAVRKGYGYAMFESFYNEDETLRERRYYDFRPDQPDEPVLVMCRDTGYAIIRYGYDDRGNITSQTFFDTEDQPVVSTKYHCAGILIEYDDYGNQTDIRYVDGRGVLMNRDNYGCAWIHKEYDPKTGNLLAEFYYDEEMKPAVRKEYGYASYRKQFDERGNWVETRYYNTEGKLTLREDAGYAIVRNKYNEYGEQSEQRYYDENDMPIISTKYHCAGFLYEYDKRGRQIKISYLGTDGELADRSDYGCASVHKQYDEAGRLVGESYFGTDEKAVIRKDRGYASFAYDYVEGRLTRKRYYGLSKNLVPDKDTGYAMETWEYDEYGNGILNLFYGVDEKPVISSKFGCAGIRSVYDEKGNNTEIWYLDFDGKLMNRGGYGCAGIVQEFDGFGDIVRAEYRDTEEQPAVRKDLGYGAFEKSFDPKTGKWNEYRYLDTRGGLTLSKAYGYAVMRAEYDSRGREKTISYYGTEEEPIIAPGYCCAGMEYFYDEKGNRKRIQYLSPEGSLMTRLDLGYAQVEKVYGDSGRLIGEDYFNTEGEPAVRKERGYASYRESYSPNGLLLESRFYGPAGGLVLRKDMGYAAVSYTYDAYGRRISSCFLGPDEKPVISTYYNCSRIVSRYEDGKEVEILYYGLDGELMNREDYGCAQILKEYDQYGFLKKETYLDREGQEVLRKDLGYARCEKQYDSYHRWVEDRYYDTQGNLALKRNSGVAVLKLERDKYGRESLYSYQGRAEEPVLNREYHCYGIRHFYDELGNLKTIQYLDSEGKMMLRSDFGCMQLRREFDAWGQLIRETYCDGTGDPVARPKYGYAARTIDYDYNREKAICYLDTEGNPTERQDTGYATVQYTYNESGKRIDTSYFDADHERVMSRNDNCAAYKYSYDERGNRTYIWYYGSDGERLVREDYGAMLNFMGYDEYDRMIWDAYYTYDGSDYKPAIRKDVGYFAVRYTYNERGQTERVEYLGIESEPVMHKENGYAESRRFYNEPGQLQFIRYYDEEGNLIEIPGGYAEIEYIYDDSGNDVDWKYRDSSGNEVTLK